MALCHHRELARCLIVRHAAPEGHETACAVHTMGAGQHDA